MASMEQYLDDLRRAYTQEPDAASIPFPERIAAGARRPPYRLTDEQLRAAQATLAKHLELTEDLEPSLDRGAPRPRSILRNMPPL